MTTGAKSGFSPRCAAKSVRWPGQIKAAKTSNKPFAMGSGLLSREFITLRDSLTTLLIIAMLCFVSGCGRFGAQPEDAADHSKSQTLGVSRTKPQGQAVNLHASIPAPSIPQDIQALARSSGSAGESGKLYRYTINCKSTDDPKLAEIFETVSRLALMRDEPANYVTVEQRLSTSLAEARKILDSQGYYEGKVTGSLKEQSDGKLEAVIRFTAGPRYVLGANKVITDGKLSTAGDAKSPPKSLAEVGLEQGVPAIADDILAAVSRVESSFRNHGYPRATVEGTRFVLDRSKRRLEAEIYVKPGPFARMGSIIPNEESTVDTEYLVAKRTWKIGQPWNQELVDDYLTSLRQSGLFQAVEGFAAREDDAEGNRPIRLRLSGAPERTIGGRVSYDTDFGPGLNAYWEHRNLTGHGDRLRLDMPLWQDMQEFTATYRYPYFLSPDLDIIANGGFLHQDTDAYELYSGAFSAGLEMRISRRWRASIMGAVEGGSLEDPGQDKKEFFMFGLPVTATYDSTNSLLDPTRGYRLIMAAAPYTGTFREDFNVVRTRVEGQAFLPMGSENYVMALRGVWGSLWGADNSQDVPSSLRFYSGGGGSVRGYDYQSVGPRNAKRDPLGGVSQVEVGAEARLRFTESIGMVAFIDGGMVYENVDSELFQDMLWGAGLGARYYTPIGPVRLDVAVPLDRRKGDSAWQLYISIGQSF